MARFEAGHGTFQPTPGEVQRGIPGANTPEQPQIPPEQPTSTVPEHHGLGRRRFLALLGGGTVLGTALAAFGAQRVFGNDSDVEANEGQNNAGEPVPTSNSETSSVGTPEGTSTNGANATSTAIPTESPTAKPTETPDTEIVRDPNSLREKARKNGARIGSLAIEAYIRSDFPYRKNLADQFNVAALDNELLWQSTLRSVPSLRPDKDTYNFSDLDALVEFTQSNDMDPLGLTLVWHQNIPAWLKEGNFSPEQLKQIMADHINTVVGRYQGKIDEWVVTKEVFANAKDNIWLTALGEGYVDFAHQTARDKNPDAKLIYSNGLGSHLLGSVSNQDFERVKRLKGKKLVDVYGIQGHIDGTAPLDMDSFKKNIKRFLELGVDVYVLEFDVNMSKFTGTEEEKLAKQAEVYKQYLQSFLEAGGRTFITFGGNDRYSWLGANGVGTMYDKSNNKKPAFAAIDEVLTNFHA